VTEPDSIRDELPELVEDHRFEWGEKANLPGSLSRRIVGGSIHELEQNELTENPWRLENRGARKGEGGTE